MAAHMNSQGADSSGWDGELEVAPGVKMAAWTYDGVVPGKVVHLARGRPIDFTLRNSAATVHSCCERVVPVARSQGSSHPGPL